MNAQLHPAPSGPLAWLLQWAARAKAKSGPALPPGRTLRLVSGDRLELEDPHRLELICLSGMVWITHEGLPDDTVIERGERYQTQATAPMLVCAIGPVRLHVVARRG